MATKRTKLTEPELQSIEAATSELQATADEAVTRPNQPAPITANLLRLEEARALPEVVGEIDTIPVEFAPGSIQRFKAGENDRRTMEVLGTTGGLVARAVSAES